MATRSTLSDVYPFSPLESLMWHLEADPSLHSRLVSVVSLDSPPNVATLRDRLERITRTVPRFRHRVVGSPLPGLRPHWELDPHFDMDFHLREVRLPEGSDADGAFQFGARVGQDSFHPNRPLWRAYVVTGLPEDRAAVVLKVHHVVTDGVGGLQMAAVLFDLQAAGRAPGELGAMPAVRIPQPRDAADRFIQGLTQETDQLAGLAHLARGAVRSGFDPRGTAASVLDSAKAALALADPTSGPGSALPRRTSPGDTYVTLAAPLDALKDAARAAGGKLNDAYLAVLVGGLRRYHEVHDASLDILRIGMPVNTRPTSDTERHGANEFTSKRFAVPAGVADPAERIAAIRVRSLQEQTSGSNLVSQSVVQAGSRLPSPLVRALTGNIADGLDINATNVPGIPLLLYLGGSGVDAFHAFIPRLRAPVSAALLSYNGTAHLGLNLDPAAIPDADVLLDCMATELDSVLTLAGGVER